MYTSVSGFFVNYVVLINSDVFYKFGTTQAQHLSFLGFTQLVRAHHGHPRLQRVQKRTKAKVIASGTLSKTRTHRLNL